MGCLASMKVKPAAENLKPPENENRIRGDRLSIADARLRREAESQNRLRRLSSLAPEEVNKVRRNSRNSSRQSTPSNLPQHDRDDNADSSSLSRDESTPVVAITTNKSKNTKNKKNVLRKKRASTLKESDEPEETANNHRQQTQIMRVNGNVQTYENSDSSMRVHQHDSIRVQHDSVQEIMLTQNFTENESDDEDDEIGDVTRPRRSKNNATSNGVNRSMTSDSLELRTNANLLVSDIMSQAILKVKRDSLIESSGGANNDFSTGQTHPAKSKREESMDYLPGSVTATENTSIKFFNGSNGIARFQQQQPHHNSNGHTVYDNRDGYGETTNQDFIPVCLSSDAEDEETKREREAADKRARSVVDQILSNALFVVKNENS